MWRAGIKKLGLADGLFGLANVEKADFFAGDPFGCVFTMVVQNIKINDRYMKQSGAGYVDQKLCVELTWTCVRLQSIFEKAADYVLATNDLRKTM